MKSLYRASAIAFILASLLALLAPPARTEERGAGVSFSRAGAGGTQGAAALGPNEFVERELKGGEAHSYRISLAANQFVRVSVEQQGGDLSVTLSGPGGRKLERFELEGGALTPEPVAFVSETAGAYVLELRAPAKNAGDVRYRAGVEEVRDADPRDRSRIAAERAFAAGARLQFGRGDAASLGEAVVKYEEALSLWRSTGDRAGQSRALGSIGNAYHSLGEYRKAVGYYEERLGLVREEKDRRQEAVTLETVGRLYFGDLGDKKNALDNLRRALPLYREAGRREGEARVLTLLGDTLVKLGESPAERREALGHYVEALGIHRAAKNRYYEGDTLGDLMTAWKVLGDRRLAIFFGKQAVNTFQDLRTGIKDLEKDTQKTFVRSKEEFYRTLADLLISEGRLPEAQQVLAMLKEEELFSFVQRDGGEALALTSRATLTPDEAALEAEYGKLADNVTLMGRQRGDLLSKSARNAEEEQQLNRLEDQLAVATDHFYKYLEQLEVSVGTATAQGARVTEIKDALGMQRTLREIGQGTALLYTLVGEERYHVVLVTPDAQQAYENPITATDLRRKVLAFREALQNPRSDPAPLARELYKVLVGPKLARDLRQAGAETLMWSLDGVLRYLPVAALQDESGKYLLETYRNVVFTPASRDRLKDPVAGRWKGLGLGVSKGKEMALPGTSRRLAFGALPGVPGELRSIIHDESAAPAPGTPEGERGVISGRIMLDEGFTKDALRAALRQQYSMVHIASHFMFQPGNEGDSFLLLGGEDEQGSRLTVAEIRRLRFEGVDLLTLSACETAMSGEKANGVEVESFGVLAQRQGAGAVMATLWPVADASTPLLMREFYRLRESQQGITKSEALRQAQLALLAGKVKPGAGGGQQRGIKTEAATVAQTTYSHPYFWAPFILIGNWK